MKKYFEWMNDYAFPWPDTIDKPEDWAGGMASMIMRGKEVDERRPLRIGFSADIAPTAAIPNSKLLLLCSDELVTFLAASGAMFQALPARVTTNAGGKEHRYSVLNLLDVRDAIDRKMSKLSVGKDGDIDDIESLVIRADRAADAVMFRLEGFCSLVICTGELVEAIRQHGFTGMKFAPLG